MEMTDFSDPTDAYYMHAALREACKAYEAGEVPIGAVIVQDGEIIARARNQVETLQDATAHAEILAITQAEAKLENWRLEEATLYVTKEPCAMCAGALVNARVKRVVFGLHDPRSGCCGGALDVTGFEGMLHQVQVTGGVMEEEARALIQAFFKAVRSGNKTPGPPQVELPPRTIYFD